MARTQRLAVAGAAVIALAAVGYALVTSSRLDRAATLARDLPFVVEAYYRSGFMWDDELLLVTVADSTTREQAAALWCKVIVPRGGDETNAMVESMHRDGFPPPATCPLD